ncbi:hypothetical protein RHMOL_Rhmol09G0180200 [Rhododendron molle]|uniref:Uncharacterized protein n=1 Tax=Rhododendron molle TaxID=49168 RepID=A0ACC0MFW3_RHOML|nr:hypothetical protein RHMOL_Rhmol09G0180200 [Rhododendron molle]
MGRGVSSGGGQSSLGYLFGSGEASKTASNNPQPAPSEGQAVNKGPPSKTAAPSQPVDVAKQIPAGINSNAADGQNSGNFITDRPSTKVHAAPGGGSSLGYLFGGGGN